MAQQPLCSLCTFVFAHCSVEVFLWYVFVTFMPLNYTLELFLVYHLQVLLLLSAPVCKRQHSQVLKQRPSHQRSGWRPLSSKWPQPGIWRMPGAELRVSCRHSSKLCCIHQRHRQVTFPVMLMPLQTYLCVCRGFNNQAFSASKVLEER